MAEKIIDHKYAEGEEVLQIRIFKVEVSEKNPEGYSYSLVYIKNGKRLVGYDNFEGHSKGGNNHHKHVKEMISEYCFVDIWQLMEDFNRDVERVKK
ncbi:hypothetical protein HYU40_05090 [Candidatus Woesearchaeota archaeon]|nr:hypothetical protein [Candidatus Woesearchaeota archaeon]